MLSKILSERLRSNPNATWTRFGRRSRQPRKYKSESMGVVFTYPDKQPLVDQIAGMRAEAGSQPEIADLIRKLDQARHTEELIIQVWWYLAEAQRAAPPSDRMVCDEQ